MTLPKEELEATVRRAQELAHEALLKWLTAGNKPATITLAAVFLRRSILLNAELAGGKDYLDSVVAWMALGEEMTMKPAAKAGAGDN